MYSSFPELKALGTKTDAATGAERYLFVDREYRVIIDLTFGIVSFSTPTDDRNAGIKDLMKGFGISKFLQ